MKELPDELIVHHILRYAPVVDIYALAATSSRFHSLTKANEWLLARYRREDLCPGLPAIKGFVRLHKIAYVERAWAACRRSRTLTGDLADIRAGVERCLHRLRMPAAGCVVPSGLEPLKEIPRKHLEAAAIYNVMPLLVNALTHQFASSI